MADSTNALRQFLDGLASDIELLMRLHGAELDETLLKALGQTPAANWFSVGLQGDDATTGLALLDTAIGGTAAPQAEVDRLAAEFADIYLTFGKRVAPDESYWLTEDHIERQEPMFAVRDWYAHYGVRAADWRKLADDHLVNELSFIATLLRHGREHALLDAGRFMDRHLLRWSQEFFAGVAERTEAQFYAGLALVSQALLLAVRQHLEHLTGEARQVQAAQPAAPASAADAPFVPGVQPGW